MLDETEKEYAKDLFFFCLALTLILYLILFIVKTDDAPEPELIDHCIPELKSK